MREIGRVAAREGQSIHASRLMARTSAAIRPVMSRHWLPISVVALSVCLPVSAQADSYDALVAKHAVANGVPAQLVRRVIRIESRGNARAVRSGNYGLMQI